MARPLVRRFHFHQAGEDLSPYIFMSPKGSSAEQSDRGLIQLVLCITKTEKTESEAQRGKPKGTLESESRKAIL